MFYAMFYDATNTFLERIKVLDMEIDDVFLGTSKATMTLQNYTNRSFDTLIRPFRKVKIMYTDMQNSDTTLYTGYIIEVIKTLDTTVLELTGGREYMLRKRSYSTLYHMNEALESSLIRDMQDCFSTSLYAPTLQISTLDTVSYMRKTGMSMTEILDTIAFLGYEWQLHNDVLQVHTMIGNDYYTAPVQQIQMLYNPFQPHLSTIAYPQKMLLDYKNTASELTLQTSTGAVYSANNTINTDETLHMSFKTNEQTTYYHTQFLQNELQKRAIDTYDMLINTAFVPLLTTLITGDRLPFSLFYDTPSSVLNASVRVYRRQLIARDGVFTGLFTVSTNHMKAQKESLEMRMRRLEMQ